MATGGVTLQLREVPVPGWTLGKSLGSSVHLLTFYPFVHLSVCLSFRHSVSLSVVTLNVPGVLLVRARGQWDVLNQGPPS